MPRNAERGGPRTRARIAEAASELFLERGFDAVTVAEVARAAGVSSVTVFNHFPRKEDLFLDRQPDAVELLQAAVRDRAPGADALAGLHDATRRLLDRRHPLSGIDERSLTFFRTVAESPALIARAREIQADLVAVLAAELDRDPAFTGDAGLVATLVLAGYAAVLVGTARRVLAGERIDDVVEDHRARFEALFAMLRSGIPS